MDDRVRRNGVLRRAADLDRGRRSDAMKHDPIELLARMAHVHATGEAGERVP